MPQSLPIAAFIFGAILTLIAILGEGFELFGAKIYGKPGKQQRIASGIFGSLLMIVSVLIALGKGANPSEPSASSQLITSIPSAAISEAPSPQASPSIDVPSPTTISLAVLDTPTLTTAPFTPSPPPTQETIPTDIANATPVAPTSTPNGEATAVVEKPTDTALVPVTPLPPTLACIDPAPLSTSESHADELKAIALSPDGLLLASASKDVVKVWKVVDGVLSEQPLYTLPHKGILSSVAFSGNGHLASASAEPQEAVKIWDMANGQLLKTYAQPDSVDSLAFSPNSEDLALGLSTSGANKTALRIMKVQSGSLLHTSDEHGGPIYSVAYSSDGQSLVTASDDKTVKLWDLGNTSLVLSSAKTFIHSSLVHTVAISPDGKLIASALWESPWAVQVWTRDGTLVRTLVGHQGPVTSVIFAPNDQSILASGATDHEVRLWDINSGRELARICNSGSAIASLAFSRPNGEFLAAGTGLAEPAKPLDRKVILWRFSDLLR